MVLHVVVDMVPIKMVELGALGLVYPEEPLAHQTSWSCCFFSDSPERPLVHFNLTDVSNTTTLLLSNDSSTLYVGASNAILLLNVSQSDVISLRHKVRPGSSRWSVWLFLLWHSGVCCVQVTWSPSKVDRGDCAYKVQDPKVMGDPIRPIPPRTQSDGRGKRKPLPLLHFEPWNVFSNISIIQCFNCNIKNREMQEWIRSWSVGPVLQNVGKNEGWKGHRYGFYLRVKGSALSFTEPWFNWPDLQLSVICIVDEKWAKHNPVELHNCSWTSVFKYF